MHHRITDYFQPGRGRLVSNEAAHLRKSLSTSYFPESENFHVFAMREQHEHALLNVRFTARSLLFNLSLLIALVLANLIWAQKS